MDVPAAVESELDGESIAVGVPLKGEDALFVTPTRTLVYRAEGLLSDESVRSFPHDAERVEVSDGRRKATVSLDYGLEGVEEFTVPSSKVDEVLRPVLAGVLSVAGITERGETVKETYRFSELTLVVTSDRLVKHIGTTVWDQDYDEIPFETVRDLDVEEGNVASQLVLTTDRRTERIKAPNDQFRAVRESVEDALFAFYDARSYEEFRRAVGTEEPAAEPSETGGATGGDFQESALDTIEMSVGEEDAESETDSAEQYATSDGRTAATEQSATEERTESADESSSETVAQEAAESRVEPEPERDSGSPAETTGETPVDREALREELEDLRESVERQRDLLDRQHERIEALLELTRDR